MRIAILGGSFNPIHLGHLFLADAVVSLLNYDRVILIPAYQSPFKPDAEGAPPSDRLDMAAAAISGDHRISISDCEIKREGVSYTIETIAEIKKRYQTDGKPGLILGDDLAASFSEWKNAEGIAREADIIIARRHSGGFGVDFPYPYTELNNEIIDVSSGLVREKIRKDENWRYLVPSGVRNIIEERGLYGFVKPDMERKNNIPLEAVVLIENAARKNLSPSRFLHSRNTALMARDLCAVYGLDPKAGYLAGIAHDICKYMKDADILKLVNSDGKKLSTFEKKKPGLLHGKAAAVLLRKKYDINDKEILDAISYHVTCEMDMGDLAKVLYIADKIEISRDWVSPHLREMCGEASLDAVFEAVLENTVTLLKSRQKDISYNTQRLLSEMEKRKANEKKNKN
ncbi:MAG: nicotinate (nicotinamide) nucleotide adenylyltransferase [Treponema sp.]|jgi:nicotinate-nucleotide adenylyltransferase|nr:nicotinate (nicotinamide) nucleotide adenylyltransferase [Treponema sp.]